MQEATIVTNSPVGQRLESVAECTPVSYLMFNKKKMNLVEKLTIGRSSDCELVIDNKLVSRFHASIQKIKDAYFLKDEGSTNGTLLNGQKIDSAKFYKLAPGDKITIGAESLVMN